MRLLKGMFKARYLAAFLESRMLTGREQTINYISNLLSLSNKALSSIHKVETVESCNMARRDTDPGHLACERRGEGQWRFEYKRRAADQ